MSRAGWKIPKRVDVLNMVIQSQAGINTKLMLKVKSGLFLLKLEMHCMIGRKVKFTSNDQNTNRFLENLKIF